MTVPVPGSLGDTLLASAKPRFRAFSHTHMTDTSHDPLSNDSEISAPPGAEPSWRRALAVGLAVYVVSRLCVIAGTAVRAAQMAVDARADGEPEPSAGSVIGQVLTSWDGKWYLEIVRGGYPSSVPPNITYEQLEARAAFFPLYPWTARALDVVLPGGDTLAALLLNFVLGAVSVVLVGSPRAPDLWRERRSQSDDVVRDLPGQRRAVVRLLRGTADRAGGRLPHSAARRAMAVGRPGRCIGNGDTPERCRPGRCMRGGQFPRHPAFTRLVVAPCSGACPDRIRVLPVVRRFHRRREFDLVPRATRGVGGGNEFRCHRSHQHLRVRHQSVVVADRRTDRAHGAGVARHGLLRLEGPAARGCWWPSAPWWLR